MVSDERALTDHQQALIAGMRECVNLFNKISRNLADADLTVDASAYMDGTLEVKIVRDVREIEIKIEKDADHG